MRWDQGMRAVYGAGVRDILHFTRPGLGLQVHSSPRIGSGEGEDCTGWQQRSRITGGAR